MSHIAENSQQTFEKLIFEGAEYAENILDSICKAKSEILISCYIVSSDKFGKSIIEILQKKAAEGLNIKLIVDGYGSRSWISENKKLLESSNFKIRTYHPIPWPFSKIELFHLTHLNHLFQLVLKANKRNHQKLFIFDRQKAVIGSRNILNQALLWRENSLVLEGPPVIELESVFESIWLRSHKRILSQIYPRLKQRNLRNPKNVYSNHLFKLRRRHQKLILSRISNAQSHIYLTTPYLYPDKKILRQLHKSARNGIDVRLLLPEISDVWISKTLSLTLYQGFINAGVKIYEYKPSILHAKAIVIDDWALIGSSNFNRRSAVRDLEIDYAPLHKKTVTDLNEKFLEDLKVSNQVNSIQSPTLLQKIFANTISIFIPSWF